MSKDIIVEKHDSEQNALIIDNYPYGYTQRTKIRYWVESVKGKGDRFCSQTLNPKTGQWNKPKKSTYCAVIIMTRDSKTGYIRYIGLHRSTDTEALERFKARIGDYPLNDLQKEELKILTAYCKAYEHVEFKVKARRFMHIETGEITESVPVFEMNMYIEVDDNGQPLDKEAEKKEQEETQKDIKRLIGHYYHEQDGQK